MKCSDLFRTAAAAALALALAAVPAVAKNNNAKVKPAVAKPASAGPKAKATTPKAQTAKPAKAQAPKAKAPTAKATTKSNTKAASTKGSSTKATRGVEDTRPASRETFAAPAPSQPLNKAQQKLAANEALRNKIRARLPMGMDPMIAASGFKNFGQFNAAVNASFNQRIDFNLLKGLMVNRGMSLGQAKKEAKAIQARRASLANTTVVQPNDEIAATSLVSVTSGKKTKGN